MIILYTGPWCPWCKKVEELLKNLGVEYEKRDVSKKEEWAKELVEKSGQDGIPVLDINGRIIIGYNEKEIKEALKDV